MIHFPPTFQLRSLALSVFVLTSAGAAPGQPAGYYHFDPDIEHGVFNRDALAHFWRAAAVGRVDVVCIGDSNQLLNGQGWDEALSDRLHARVGLYATGLIPSGENLGAGAGIGWRSQGLFPAAGTGFQFNGAPAIWNALVNAPQLLRPQGYLFAPSGASLNTSSNLGLLLQADAPLDINGPLRYWITHATFGTPAPPLTPEVRMSEPPYQTLTTPIEIPTTSNSDGVTTSFLDLNAGDRTGAINFRPLTYGTPAHGPFVQFYSRIESPEVRRGASLHTLYGYGGQSARDMGEALLATSDQGLSLYFSLVRAGQGTEKHVLVRVACGVNDRSETLPSLGSPPVSPPNVPAAFKANARAIIDRVRGIWALNQWDERELFFLLSISPPIQGPPDDSLMQSYRDVADELALEFPRTAVTHFERMYTIREGQFNRWLLFDIDTFHFRPEGHLALAGREIDAARLSAAWIDLNGDGAIDPEDLSHEFVINQNSASASGTVPVSGNSPQLVRAVRWDENSATVSER